MITITRGEDTWYTTSRVADATPTVFVVDGDASARAVVFTGWADVRVVVRAMKA